LNLKITVRTYTKNHVFLNGKSTRILSASWVEEQIFFSYDLRVKEHDHETICGRRTHGVFSDPPDVRDQRLVNEQESSEALWQPLTRRNFELFSLGGCAGRWDVTSSGAVSNPAMRVC
jgi:hypothetical protein